MLILNRVILKPVFVLIKVDNHKNTFALLSLWNFVKIKSEWVSLVDFLIHPYCHKIKSEITVNVLSVFLELLEGQFKGKKAAFK